MSWKNIVRTAVVCALLTPAALVTPVDAAPTITVSPGMVVGPNREWTVSVTPDVATFVPQSSLAVEIDLEFTGTILGFTINGAFWNHMSIDNVGNNPFTGTVTATVLNTAPANDTLFIAAGSELFTTATSSLLATVTTMGTTGTMSWGGRTALPGTIHEYMTSRVAQNGANNNGLSGSASATACIDGDFNCGGGVENADLTLLLNNWGSAVPPTPVGWLGTPPTAPAIDNDELTLLLNNWGNVAGSGSLALGGASAVPEPATVALAGLALAAGLGFARRRRK